MKRTGSNATINDRELSEWATMQVMNDAYIEKGRMKILEGLNEPGSGWQWGSET